MNAMEIIKAKLMSLTVFRNMLETEPVKCLLRLTEAKTPDGLIKAYADLLYTVWNEGHRDLPACLSWHLKYEDSFFGHALAAGKTNPILEDAAALDIRRIAGIAMLSCAGLKRNIYTVCTQRNPEYGPIIQNMPELPEGTIFTEEEIFDSLRKNGCGQFALGRTFHYEHGALTSIRIPAALKPEDMIGYTNQRNAVIENTRALISGAPANNVLLYGDSGTGKSATIKSLIQIPEFYNLRIVEIARNSLSEITALIKQLGAYTQKFIVYIDDLSFEKEDASFSELKTALEGGLEARPQNVIICVTSNRRHMIRESFSDREGDDVHAKETLEERTSLAERFGLRLAYLSLDKRRYNEMVLEMCRKLELPLEEGQILVEANRWEIQHGGRTPRVAEQLVNHLAGQVRAKQNS